MSTEAAVGRQTSRHITRARVTHADRVLVVVPGVGALALSLEAYKAALEDGAALIAASGAPPTAVAPGASALITAGELGAAACMSRTTIYELAKTRRIPSVRVGRSVRFDRAKGSCSPGEWPNT